ncbi:MAG: NAD(P)H nitroreductase [Bacteroidetes bacterium]|nr:NAD(P)H nitroreductase [Bacteroidota bacterium]MAE08079.1 NAD(P)H nitroreductase [Bacteroidota bacterium]|tara:strand:- start:16 stop:561 length:546 start_codon:yes stop_codon:yes gene_type:complete
MDFHKLISLRQSDRKYINKPVDREIINRCIEAARLAPSASNSQPWTFIVVDDDEIKDKVGRSTFGPLKSFNKFVPQAPVIIAIVLEKPKIITEIGGRIKNKEYPLMDIGIAAEHICLQAAEEGLGSCMLGWFDERTIKLLLNIPENKNVPLLVTLGYTPEDYKHRKKIRKSMDKIVKYNSY